MSEKQTDFRRKGIRLAASAAICGLSISFILGEALDSKSYLFNESVVDYALRPRDFPVLTPVLALKDFAEKTNWQESYIAQMQVMTPAEPLKVPAEVAPAAPQALSPVVENKVSTTAATNNNVRAEEPIKTVAAAPASTPAVDAGEDIDTEKINGLLLSVHEAAAKISDSPAVLTESKAEKKVVISAEGKDRVVLRAAAPVMNGKIRGRVISTKFLGAGHFEVGIYDKINASGLPIGYPLTQQILPEGVFDYQLTPPSGAESAYVFAHFLSHDGKREFWFAPPVNPVNFNDSSGALASLDINMMKNSQPQAASVASFAEAKSVISGKVATQFAKSPISQQGVIVKLRGAKASTTTNEKGEFRLELPSLDGGSALIEFLKPGYMPMIEKLNARAASEPMNVEIASKDIIDHFANSLGLRQQSAKSVLVVKILNEKGQPISGATAHLSLKAEGPYYFNHEGVPVSGAELKATSSDGRLIYFNVDSGVGFLEQTVGGETVAPVIIGTVDGGGLVSKNFIVGEGRLQGRVFNPVTKGAGLEALRNAKLRVEGSSEWTSTDSFGAFDLGSLKFVLNEELALELSAEKFYNHRFIISGDGLKRKKSQNLYAFPAAYVNKLANSVDVQLDPYAGLVMGGVGKGKSVRIDALAEHSLVNDAKDFYFDNKGVLRGSYAQTDRNFGTFIVFNVPRGREILMGRDSTGQQRYSNVVYTTASTISVVLPEQ